VERHLVKVSVFITCLVDSLYPNVGSSLVRLLRRLEVEVSVPLSQTCCGQMQVNSGYSRMALPLIRNHIRAFEGADYVIAPSASCVASVRHQYAKIACDVGDVTLIDAVDDLASRTYELSEFLVDVLGVVDVGAYFPHRVTYHPTCHSLRSLRVGSRPRRLLEAVEGIELIELPQSEACCGFGGTFAVKNSSVSIAMLQDKLASVRHTGADVLCAADASCLMHIGGGLSRAGDFVAPAHLVEILSSTR
jgi:L-lactate dehydrogenase complex protein LldE